ncbi:MAG: protein kinase, partial [Nitrospirales bacterium]
MIGKTLSHYKVLEKIGQGGMGEVYRTKDSTLKREVAIKLLPEQFTKDPQRLARFEREAQLLASLNHPNIAAIYGLEEADGVRFLALELVPGETLAERVAKGPATCRPSGERL